MNRLNEKFLNFAYCIVLLNAALPFGLSTFSWIKLLMGGSIFFIFTIIMSFAFLFFCLYRIYLVLRGPSTLIAPDVAGIPRFMQTTGAVIIYIGSVLSLLNVVVTPLLRASTALHRSAALEQLMTEFFLGLMCGIGYFGLLLFEFGRLIAFEREAKNAWRDTVRE